MRKPVSALALGVALLLVPCTAAGPRTLPAQEEAATGEVEGWKELVDRFRAYANASGIVGGSAAALRDGRIVERFHYGYADESSGRVVDDSTLFHWGSITKTLTAIAIMQLRDRGLLSLHDPVVRWVPELRLIHDPYGAVDSITIERLLTHSAGLQGPTWPWTEGREWEPFEPTTWNQLVAMMPYQQLRFPPGERFSYSNPGFIYLARIIESVTGDPWQSYVHKNLFSPLGLARSYFGSTPWWLAAHRSHGYDVVEAGDEGETRLVDHGADFDPGITIPNGGWNGPVEDLAAYAAFFSADAPADPAMRPRWEAVLSRSTLEEMWTPRLAVSEDGSNVRADSLGLSFFVVRDGDRSVIGHTGSQAGYRAFFYFQPEKSAAVILVFNTSNEAAGEEATAAFDAMMRAAFRVADPPAGSDRTLPGHGTSMRAGPEARPAIR